MRTRDIRDPVDIERLLVWTYRDQRADMVINRGMGLHDQEAALDGRTHYATSRCGVAAMQRVGMLGTRVDGGGASAGALHEDAEVVHEAVMRLDMPIAMLVIRHARSASRPDEVTIPPRRPFPVKSARGRIIREYAEWDISRHYGWTPITWTVQPTTAEVVCLEYTMWRRALAALSVTLANDVRLTRHRATPPTVPIEATLRSA